MLRLLFVIMICIDCAKINTFQNTDAVSPLQSN